MSIDRALYLDQASSTEVLESISAIAIQLQNFKTKYPQVFRHLCTEGREGADFTLADGLSALNWAADRLGGV
jgi:hypothetical protein